MSTTNNLIEPHLGIFTTIKISMIYNITPIIIIGIWKKNDFTAHADICFNPKIYALWYAIISSPTIIVLHISIP